MLSIIRYFCRPKTELLSSTLFNEETFYSAFAKDLQKCKEELLIESPFLTCKRVSALLPSLRQLNKRRVKITINTRTPQQHDIYMRLQSERAVALLQDEGIQVLFTGGHHRKIAAIDRLILWEGSLNILSQRESCEYMRRIESATLVKQTLSFIGVRKYLK